MRNSIATKLFIQQFFFLSVVCKINCVICGKSYVGQTKRLLKIRCNEHIKNIKLNSKYHNVITKHIIENRDHNFKWEKIQKIHKENNLLSKSESVKFHWLKSWDVSHWESVKMYRFIQWKFYHWLHQWKRLNESVCTDYWLNQWN